MNCLLKESWESTSVRDTDAYEAWVDKLMFAQGSDWCPGKTPSGAFSASLRHKVIGDINVIESRCDPCSGYRTDKHAALVEEPSVILLSYLEGGEHIEFGGERYTVGAGDTFMGTILVELYRRNLNAQDIGRLALEDLKHILERATIAAAVNCQSSGCNPPYAKDL